MNFGERIRELRKERGLSQRELAAQAGIDFTYLSKIENARIEPPSEKVILHMAQALDTDPDELTLLAGKIPSDVRHHIDVNMIKALRRSLDGDFNSGEDLRRALADERDRGA